MWGKQQPARSPTKEWSPANRVSPPTSALTQLAHVTEINTKKCTFFNTTCLWQHRAPPPWTWPSFETKTNPKTYFFFLPLHSNAGLFIFFFLSYIFSRKTFYALSSRGHPAPLTASNLLRSYVNVTIPDDFFLHFLLSQVLLQLLTVRSFLLCIVARV